MADKETCVQLGCLHLQTLTNTGSILPRPLSPRLYGGTEEGSLLWWTLQMIKGDGGLP